MTLPNPYEAPQSTLSAPHVSEERKLPAIVGVGSTLTFWSTLVGFVFYVSTTLFLWFDPAYEANGLYRLLAGLDFWVIPVLKLLGYLLLYQTPEESRAKGYLKAAMILYAAHKSWQIALFFEKHPEEVPAAVNSLFQLVGIVAGLCMDLACLRLSRYCEDIQMTRWARLTLFSSICFSLLATIHEGLYLADPQFLGEVSLFVVIGATTLYELLAYSIWITWILVILFHCLTLWRIPLHAELEARPMLDPRGEVE